jgi:hypothetical protein
MMLMLETVWINLFKPSEKKFNKRFCRQVRKQMSTGVDGGLSGLLSEHKHGGEDPIQRHILSYYDNVLNIVLAVARAAETLKVP